MTIYLDNQEVTDEILVGKWLEYNGQIIHVMSSAINHDTGHIVLRIAPAVRQKIRDFAYIELTNNHHFNTVDVPKHNGDVIYNSENLPLTIKDAMSFMVGTISQDYLLVLKDVEPFETGKGPYANYLTVDEHGHFEDIIFSEAHIHHYSKENVHAVFTGDFFAWENISRLKEL